MARSPRGRRGRSPARDGGPKRLPSFFRHAPPAYWASVTGVASYAVPNRLAAETSPYLLQHKDNPVDWYPWGEEALAPAHEDDKQILLSVGYSAWHRVH